MKITYLKTLLATAILTGCSSTELPQLSPTDVPTQWQAGTEAASREWPSQDWWTEFDNDELNRYLVLVMNNNFDLAINDRNLASAQILLRDAGFDLLPTPVVSVSTQPAYSERRADGESLSGSSNTDLVLGVSASYNNILSKPAIYDSELADYDYRVAQAADFSLNTFATAASIYFQLLLTRDRISFTEVNVANAQTIYEIALARVDSGLAVPIEALQQQIALERERISLQNFRQDEIALRGSLALLSGQSIQGFDLGGSTLDAVAIPDVQPGLTSELLTRRPDLALAEAELRSARANVDVVKTSFLPQISLTASGSVSSSSLSALVANPDSLIALSSSIAQVLLDNGERGRNTDLASLALENTLSRYRSAVINAFNEVEIILGNVTFLAAQSEVAMRNLDAAEESFRIAELRYQEGVVDFETVLNTQNVLFQTRSSYLDSKLTQLNVAVALYQALGGGWEIAERSAI